MAVATMGSGGSQPSVISTEQATPTIAKQGPNPFDVLPIETNQHIASYFPSDFDICNFILVSHSTYDAIHADNNSYWRRRFLDTFEKPSWNDGVVGSNGKTVNMNLKFKQVYQKRRRSLLYAAKFEAALSMRSPKETRKGVEALEMLRDLIVESFSEKKDLDDGKVYESSNLTAIIHFATQHDLLQRILTHDTTQTTSPTTRRTRASHNTQEIMCIPRDLLLTIQVLLAPILLQLDRNYEFLRFPESRRVVYGTALEHPIFGGCHGLDVSMEWVLHHINFWRYHMLRKDEHTLHPAYEALMNDERPRFWDRQLKQGGGEKLGTYWKGSYAYLDRELIADIRRGKVLYETDEFNGDAQYGTGSFQDLRLDLKNNPTSNESSDLWPQIFEDALHSLSAPPSRAKTRAQRRSAEPESVAGHKPLNFQFTGEGHDATEDFFAQGWLNALPAQQGVPGWQRMTMMKYFQDEDTGAIDYEALWAYEGVVLPGGQIILGRWWSPGDGTGAGQYSGPFILWCVDGPRYADVAEDEVEVNEDSLP